MKNLGEENVIIIENKKYRIRKTVSDKSDVLVSDFWTKGRRVRYQLGKVTARLEQRQTFMFWSFWHTIEFTNIVNVVQEWMVMYFDGAKLWNGKGSRYETRNGVKYEITELGTRYEITKDGQRYCVDKNDKRWNPAHTPKLGSRCGCSGCDGCLGGPAGP